MTILPTIGILVVVSKDAQAHTSSQGDRPPVSYVSYISTDSKDSKDKYQKNLKKI